MSVLSKKQNDKDGIYYWLETMELWEVAEQSLQGSLSSSLMLDRHG